MTAAAAILRHDATPGNFLSPGQRATGRQSWRHTLAGAAGPFLPASTKGNALVPLAAICISAAMGADDALKPWSADVHPADATGNVEAALTATLNREVRKLDEKALIWGGEKVLSTALERLGPATQKFVIVVQ